MDINQLLQITVDRNASDLHLTPDYNPTIRINNELLYLKTFPVISGEDSQVLIFQLLSTEQKDALLNNKEIDFGFQFGRYRFRANVFYEKNKIAGAFRLIPPNIKTISELKLPTILSDFTKIHQGLILMTGPTGEGKSTSLAAMINEINLTASRHIITIEDPIEFVYPVAQSLISQRELYKDTHSMSLALKSILREDPDIVLVGEMRDYDTIQSVLTIAETGHLVLSTLHTKSAPETIDRIIDVFPSSQQNQIRNQLASVLVAVVAQRLVPTADGTSRIPALEILINNAAVSSIIRDGKTFLLDNVLETSEESKMILMEKDLLRLYNQNEITKETAFAYCVRPHEIKKFIL